MAIARGDELLTVTWKIEIQINPSINFHDEDNADGDVDNNMCRNSVDLL